MSSILDALNKLEKDAPPQAYPLTHTRSARKGFLPTSAIVIIGLVCVCVGAIGFVVYYQKSSIKMPEAFPENVRPVANVETQNRPKPEASRDEQSLPLASSQEMSLPSPSTSQDLKSTAAVNRPEAIFMDDAGETQPSAVSATEPETVSMDDATKTQPKSPETANSTAAVKTEKRSVTDLKTKIAETPVEDKVFREPEPQVLTKQKNETPAPLETVSKEMPTREEAPLPMDRLEGVSFRIQAISWGDVARERLVVINNQVLREGDRIEGYQISHINPDDIVLRRNGIAYQLDFSLKGSP